MSLIVAGLALATLGLVGVRGSACRVSLDVDPRWVQTARSSAGAGSGQDRAQRAVAAALSKMGAGEVLLVTQDPTSERIWSAITSRSPSRAAGPVRVTLTEAVDHPGAAPRRFSDVSLDHGLTQDDADAIGRALSTESDPKRLEGLARSFDQDFPVAASALRCKSRLETLARIQNRVRRIHETTPLPIGARALSGALGRIARSVGAPGSFALYDPVFASAAQAMPDRAVERGKRSTIARMLMQRTTSDASRVADGFGFACAELSARPELCGLAPSKLSEATRVEPLPAALALASCQPEGPGLLLVDAETSRRVLAHGPRPVSHGALQMAHAMMRPEGSLVDSPRTLSKDLGELERGARRGDPQALRARAEVGRARRLLDRQSWIGWYKRQAAAER